MYRLAEVRHGSRLYFHFRAKLTVVALQNIASLPVRTANAPRPASQEEDSTMNSDANEHRQDEEWQREKEDLQQQVWDALDAFQS
jgi:hypothetical protein